MITIGFVCVHPHNGFWNEFLAEVFGHLGLSFITGFMDISTLFLYTSMMGLSSYCFSFLIFLFDVLKFIVDDTDKNVTAVNDAVVK